MVNYFDSISLYRWSMSEIQVSKFETKLDKLEWRTILILQLFIAVILAISSFLLLKNMMSSLPVSAENMMSSFAISSGFWVILISNMLIGFLFILGSYYFFKIFFKTELTLIQFYIATSYLYLPLLLMYTLMSLIAMGLSFVDITYVTFAFLLYIFIIYYGFKELSTYIYLFKTEFNTTEWKLFGVLILWGIITRIILTQLNAFLLSLLNFL